jgi:hypothetical protein
MKPICENGKGRIALAELLSAFPDLPADQVALVTQRGNLDFTYPEFRNFGSNTQINFTVNHHGFNINISIYIPVLLKGKYQCNENGFFLLFRDGDGWQNNTLRIIARFALFTETGWLEGIEVSQNRIFLNMDNDKMDIEVV